MATRLFEQMAGIRMRAVLYPGSGQTVTDLIAGRIQVMFAPSPTVVGLIGQGTVKPLASTQSKRARIAPELPTISEAALPGYDTGVWFCLLAPAGTADAVIDRLSKASNAALSDPEVLRQLGIQGLEALLSSRFAPLPPGVAEALNSADLETLRAWLGRATQAEHLSEVNREDQFELALELVLDAVEMRGRSK